MFLDRCIRLALRNFSTLFLLIAVVIGPLHVAFAFWYRDILSLGDIDAARAVEAGVLQAGEVGWMQRVGLALLAVELLLVPLLRRGAARVIERDAAGEVPALWEAVRALTVPRSGAALPAPQGNPVIAGLGSLGLGLALGSSVALVGGALVDLVPAWFRFVGIAAFQTVARASALIFVVVFFALLGARAKGGWGAEPTS